MICFITLVSLVIASPNSSESLSDFAISSCPALTAKAAATSVQDLRIDDITVIAAIGDSITAGYSAIPKADVNGAIGLGDLREDRGKSFSTGGDSGAESLGNFMAQFSSKVSGRSYGSRGLSIFMGHNNDKDALNAGVVRAEVNDLSKQVDWVYSQMQNDKTVNIENDFKLMTLYVGANNICSSCITAVDPAQWANEIRSVLKKLEAKIPRLIVILPHLFKLSQVWDVTGDVAYCDKRRASPLTGECICAFLEGADGVAKRAAMDKLSDQLNAELDKIREEYVAKNSASFMVTVDPSVSGFSMKEFGLDYISNIDCFHPSQEAHAVFARALWNNLNLSFDQKSKTIRPFIQSQCPTSDSRIKF
jgi:phospholipase B1